jgi:hypothetical protein
LAADKELSLTLSVPLDCTFGETCFIQQYLDHDPSADAKDYRGGSMSYDGHSGVDLRVPSMAAQQKGVSVLAAAAGVVKATRDGVADVNVRVVGVDSVASQQCGNGVMIAHDGGWETQYCHLAKGSVRVRQGERVEAGTPLGLVGLSGRTEFPHLHFSVFRNGELVDPFAADAPGTSDVARSLWSARAAEALAYRSPTVINFGFSAVPVSMEDIELGRAGSTPPNGDSPMLVAFIRAIGLNAADVQSFTLRGPHGDVLAHSENPPLDRNVAQHFMFVGKRKARGDWPRGRYEAEFEIRRGGATALSRRFSFELR